MIQFLLKRKIDTVVNTWLWCKLSTLYVLMSFYQWQDFQLRKFWHILNLTVPRYALSMFAFQSIWGIWTFIRNSYFTYLENI